jgi:hypothetical protein
MKPGLLILIRLTELPKKGKKEDFWIKASTQERSIKFTIRSRRSKPVTSESKICRTKKFK